MREMLGAGLWPGCDFQGQGHVHDAWHLHCPSKLAYIRIQAWHLLLARGIRLKHRLQSFSIRLDSPTRGCEL